MTARLELTVPCGESAMATVLEALEPFLEAAAVPAALRPALYVVLDELVANVSAHAHPEGGLHSLEIVVRVENDGLWLEVVDDGIAFDPLGGPTPELAHPLEEREIGGIGLHLVRTLMDEARYERRDGRNRLTLRKAFPGERPPA